MVAVNDTRERILNGALEALAVYGTRRFSVSAASEHARVSRGTLYRYFQTKEELLSALTAHVGGDFRRHLTAAISADPALDRRLEVVSLAMRDYVDNSPLLTRLLETEPAFVGEYYRTQFQDLVRLVAVAIAPALGSVDEDLTSRPGILAAAETMVRVAISYRIVDGLSSALPIGDFPALLAKAIGNSASVLAPAPQR